MSTPTYIDPSSLNNCTIATCAITTSFYNYRIVLFPNAFFLSIFALSLVIYLTLYILKRRFLFFAISMKLGILAEMIGYIGRILSYKNQWDENPFLIQTICLTCAPAFFSAGIYVCLARICTVYGEKNSLITPRWFTRIFIPCDIAAILLQAAGGAISAIALQSNSSLTIGDDVIIAGLALQVYTMLHFILLAIYIPIKIHRRTKALGTEAVLPQDPNLVALRCSWQFRGFLWALGISTIAVFWRSVYRVAELNQGWNGPLTRNQGLFIGFEGALMVIAVGSLAVFHPEMCLGNVGDGMEDDGRLKEDSRRDEMAVLPSQVTETSGMIEEAS